MLNAQLANGLRALSVCATALATVILTNAAACASGTPARVDTAWPNTQPAYPASAQASGEQGTVLVDVYVRPSGHVSKFRISQSSGFGDLDDAAEQTVMNWRFVPATRNGDTVSDWTTVKIVFQLPEPPAPTTPQPAQ
jgi:protein TonB